MRLCFTFAAVFIVLIYCSVEKVFIDAIHIICDSSNLLFSHIVVKIEQYNWKVKSWKLKTCLFIVQVFIASVLRKLWTKLWPQQIDCHYPSFLALSPPLHCPFRCHCKCEESVDKSAGTYRNGFYLTLFSTVQCERHCSSGNNARSNKCPSPSIHIDQIIVFHQIPYCSTNKQQFQQFIGCSLHKISFCGN